MIDFSPAAKGVVEQIKRDMMFLYPHVAESNMEPDSQVKYLGSFAERYFVQLKFLQESVPDFSPEELAKTYSDFAVHYRKRNGTNVTKTFTGIHNDMRFYRDARRTLIQQETANQSQK